MKKQFFATRRILPLLLCITMLFPMLSFGTSAAEKDDEVTVVFEDVSKRTENEKHFVLSDGSILAVSYGEAVHQPDGNGGFEDIDNSLVFNDITKRFENPGNKRFSVSIASVSGDTSVTVEAQGAPAISFTTKIVKDETVLEPTTLPQNTQVRKTEKNNFKGQKVEDAQFELDTCSASLTNRKSHGLLSGISTQRTVIGNGLKEDVILYEKMNVSSFITEYTVSELKLTADSDSSLTFYDASEKAVYSVSVPYTYDAVGSVCPSVPVSVCQTSTGYCVTYTPDAEWLLSEDRVYPITFDPLVSDSSLSSSRFSETAYEDTGVSVTSTAKKIKVGYDYTQGSNKRYYTKLKLNAYPSVDTGLYDVQSVKVNLTVSAGQFNARFSAHKLNTSENPGTSGFVPGATSYFTTIVGSPITNLSLPYPADYYTNGTKPSIVLMPKNMTSGTAKSVEFCSTSNAVAASRPNVRVTYRLKENFDNRVGFISRMDDDGRKYLSLDENNALTVSAVPYRWIFDQYLTGWDYTISSFEEPDYYLQANNDHTVTVRALTGAPDVFLYWAPVALETPNTYLFYSQYFDSFLHLSDSGLVISNSLDIDGHSWRVDIYQENSTADELNLGVFTFQAKTQNGKYMAVENAYNYNVDETEIQSLVLSDTPNLYDQGAFRLLYYPYYRAYRLAPICSGNGYYRVVSNQLIVETNESNDVIKVETNVWGINCISNTDHYQMFDLLYQTNGTIVFQLRGTTKALTISNNIVQLSDINESNISNQQWNATIYSVGDVPYEIIENFYMSYNFQSPFGENSSNMCLTSGFGPRANFDSLTHTLVPYIYGSEIHKGIDLSAEEGTDLFSPLDGVVVYINNDYSGPAGKRIVIRLNASNYSGNKSIYVVYMHMSVINPDLSVGSVLNQNNGRYVGKTGGSGGDSMTGYDPHLHVAVFQADYPYQSINFDNSPWTYESCKLNPLLFFRPNNYNVTLDNVNVNSVNV